VDQLGRSFVRRNDIPLFFKGDFDDVWKIIQGGEGGTGGRRAEARGGGGLVCMLE